MIALKIAEVNPPLRVQIRQRFAEKIVCFTRSLSPTPHTRGLLKYGSAIVFFEDSFPKQRKLYGLMTKPSEVI